MSGPATGRRSRAVALRAVLPCLALIALDPPAALAQTLTPELLRPVRDGFITPQDSPLRRTSENNPDKTSDPASDDRLKDTPAPSRIGKIPTYGLPAANGASDSGYDSLNRTRRKPKFYPGQARTKAADRTGQSGAGAIDQRPGDDQRAAAAVDPAVGERPQDADGGGNGRHRRRSAAAQAAQDR